MDTISQSLNLASRLVNASEALMSAWEELQNLKSQKESSGTDFLDNDFEAALATSDVKHVNGARLNSVLSSTDALTTFLETNFHDDIFQQVRRGG